MYLGDDPEPGTPEFGQQAAARRAAILSTPIPPTSAPPLLFLPAQAVARGVAAGARAVGEGLFSSSGGLLIVGGLALGAYLLFKGRR